MLSFSNDYSEGAHEKVLERLIATNAEKLPGYGSDKYCALAKEKIRLACRCKDADIYFLTGGTQTNAVVIGSMLKGGEGVVCASSGHINVHEAGSVELTGHKVLSLPHENGKISPKALKDCLEAFYGDENREHMIYPSMVYISHPTEYGTLYTKAELSLISALCRQYGMALYMDGARLGYALAADDSDLSLPDIAELCDVFYIGGTKVGALCGEAVVFTKNNTPPHFITLIKSRGALMAKGRLLGVQFDALFTDELYLKISKNAIAVAELLKEVFRKKGYSFYINSPTNQIFVVLDNKKMETLKEKVTFSFWEKLDETHTVVRFATSWATTKQDVEALAELL